MLRRSKGFITFYFLILMIMILNCFLLFQKRKIIQYNTELIKYKINLETQLIMKIKERKNDFNYHFFTKTSSGMLYCKKRKCRIKINSDILKKDIDVFIKKNQKNKIILYKYM